MILRNTLADLIEASEVRAAAGISTRARALVQLDRATEISIDATTLLIHHAEMTAGAGVPIAASALIQDDGSVLQTLGPAYPKGVVDVSFDENDLLVQIQSVEKIPYLWGPALMEVRVWK